MRIEKVLIEAAKDAGLNDPFFQVIELGNFSVTYRVSGFLTDVKTLITARSHLHEQVLDKLHELNIEIVSPNFMNQRVFPVEKQFIPERIPSGQLKDIIPGETNAEKIIFDKADDVEKLEVLTETQKKLREKLENLQAERDKGDNARGPALEKEIIQLEHKLRTLEAKIEKRRAEMTDQKKSSELD